MSDAKRLYKSKAWVSISKAYALSKNCICERCGRPVYVGGISEWLPKERRLGYIVHHKTYLNSDNITDDNIAYHTDNLELLCQDCHNREHHSGSATKEGVMFDEMGNLVKTPRSIKRNQ